MVGVVWLPMALVCLLVVGGTVLMMFQLACEGLMDWEQVRVLLRAVGWERLCVLLMLAL